MFYLGKLAMSEFSEFSILELNWNRNLGKLGNIYNICKSQKCAFLEEVGNFRDFRVFDFGRYTEIENSENSEIFPTIGISKECVLLEEVRNFWDFRVFDFRLTLKSKTRKSPKYLQHL